MERLNGVDGAGLLRAAQSLVDQLGEGAAVVAAGVPHLVEAGGRDGAALSQALEQARQSLVERLLH